MGTHPIFESDFDCLTDMAILADIKWNLAHIQNSFIIDQSGTCEQVIHQRDQRTVAQIARMREEAKEAGLDYDSSPEIRPPYYNFTQGANQRDRSNTDRFLAEIAQNRKNCSKTKKISNHDEIETERPRATRPATREEIRKRIERRKAASLKVTQAIQKVQPEDKRPFAQFLKYEVNNPDIPALCYKVALYKQDGHCRTPLYFQRKQQFMKVKIRQNEQYKHLVGLTCFYYANSPGFNGPKLLHSEVSEKTHSIYIIENGNIEPELKINLSQDLKKAAFDMKALKELGMRETLESDTLCLKKNFQVIPDSKTVGELIDTRLMKQGQILYSGGMIIAFQPCLQ